MDDLGLAETVDRLRESIVITAPTLPTEGSTPASTNRSVYLIEMFEAVEFATLEWVNWFNYRRLLEPIGNIPPAEAEERYYAMLEQPAMAA
jgi:transposase InsO family protein